MIVVLLYPLLESPIKNHTPSAIFCGDASSPEAPRTRQTISTARNNTRQSHQQPTPPFLLVPKTQRPRVCAAFVVIDDETLAIATTLRTTRTRSPPTATTPAARPSLSARSVRSLAAGNCRDCRSTIGAVEIGFIRRLILIEIIPVLIDVIRDLLRARRNSNRFNPSSIRANLARLRQTELRALLPQNRLPRKLNPIPFDRKHLHQNLIAFTKLVFDLLHAMFRNLRDVQQAVSPGEDLNERAELSQANNLAQIRLSDLRHSRKIADHLDSSRQTIGIARSHIDPTRIVDIDLHASRIDDPANHLATGPNQVTNLVCWNLNGMNARCKLRLLFARIRDDPIHRIQKEQPALSRLLQSLAHDLRSDAHDLDIHLQRSNSLTRTGNLEVHVAIVIFRAGDVRQDGIVFALLHQTHRNTCDRALDRNARLHQGKRRTAHRSHRRRSIRLQNVRNNPQRIRRLIFRRQNGLDCPRRQRAMTDLATTHATHTSNLTNRKRRKVIVQHEAPLLLVLIALKPLRIVGSPQRRTHQRLRLTPCKQRRPMDPRKHTNLNRQVANLIERPMIRPDPLLQNLLTEDLLAQQLIVFA